MMQRMGCAVGIGLLIFGLSYAVGRQIALQAQAVPTVQSPATQTPMLETRSITCNSIDDLNCADFASGADAAAHISACGDEDELDHDGDGRACEGGG